jgi:hypothetical protein
MKTYTAFGFAFDPLTRDWTKRVEYNARNKMEAIRWCNFQRNWMKDLQVVEIKLGSGNFYTV